MKVLRGKIDENDLVYFVKRFGMPVLAIPAPITRHKGKPKINPHLSRFILKDGRIVDVFHIKPIYYLSLIGEWRPLYEVCYGYGNKWAVLKEDYQYKIHPEFLRWWMKRMQLIKGNISVPWISRSIIERDLIRATTDTFYPDPDPETNTVDGETGQNTANGSTWATARGGAGNQSNDSAITWRYVADHSSLDAFNCFRTYMGFDTSSIPDESTIDSADVSLFFDDDGNLNSADGYDIGLLKSNQPASATALVSGDFTAFVSPRAEVTNRLTASNLTNLAYNTLNFNAADLSYISKTGVTWLCGQTSYDIDNVSPPVNNHHVRIRSAEYTGTTSDPKLVVTYTLLVSTVDILSLSDSVTASFGTFINASDVFSLSESVTTSFGTFINASDAFSLSEIVSQAVGSIRQVADKIGLTDSISVLSKLSASIKDTLNFSETVKSSITFTKSIADSIGLTDVVNTALTFGIAIADKLTLVETMTKRGWTFLKKNAASWTYKTKNATTWTFKTKNRG